MNRIAWILPRTTATTTTTMKTMISANEFGCLCTQCYVMCVYIQELINQLNIKQTRTIAGTPKIRHEWHMIRNSPNFIFWIYLVSSMLGSFVTSHMYVLVHVIEVGPLFLPDHQHILQRPTATFDVYNCLTTATIWFGYYGFTTKHTIYVVYQM